MKRSLEPTTALAQQAQGDLHVSHEAVQSPYLNAQECAAFLRFPSLKAFYKWVAETPDFPRLRRGKRTLLFNRRTVEAFIDGTLPRRSSVLRRSNRDLHAVDLRPTPSAKEGY